MSFFSWLSPGRRSKPLPDPESSGLSRMESTKPYPGGRPAQAHGSNAQPANRKSERMARRELLYSVVRQCMTNAGVLSTGYKFKVLSLDARGTQFLVMVDLARVHSDDTNSLAEIEAMIAQSAKARFDIIVTSVYWRLNEHVAVGINSGRPAAARAGTPSNPAPLSPEGGPQRPMAAAPAAPGKAAAAPAVAPAAAPAAASAPAAAAAPATASAPAQAALSRSGARYEPIQNDEVEAFKRALASGASGPEALEQAGGVTARDFDGSVRHGPQSYTLLTGFEDTELAGDDPPLRPGALSTTQYGDLR